MTQRTRAGTRCVQSQRLAVSAASSALDDQRAGTARGCRGAAAPTGTSRAPSSIFTPRVSAGCGSPRHRVTAEAPNPSPAADRSQPVQPLPASICAWGISTKGQPLPRLKAGAALKSAASNGGHLRLPGVPFKPAAEGASNHCKADQQLAMAAHQAVRWSRKTRHSPRRSAPIKRRFERR